MCLSGLERHPSYLSARVTLGRALQALGRLEEARSEFERVIAVAPDNLAAIRALAELHGETEDQPTPASAPVHVFTPPPAAQPDVVVPDVPAVLDVPEVPDLRARLALEEWLTVLERERASAPERL